MNSIKMNTFHEAGPFRFVDCGYCPIAGADLRLQEQNEITGKWFDVYEFDNQMQALLAIEDHDYALWLTGKPAYAARTDTITNPYK